MDAAASFLTFSPSVPEMSPPERPIGVDAPTLVAGAIAATGADRRMNAPAEAARAPLGATYAMTGIGEVRNDCVISLIEEPGPPGVSILSRTASAPSACARATWAVRE